MTEKLRLKPSLSLLRRLPRASSTSRPTSSATKVRCGFPSNFDADYCYSLGYTAFVLAASGLTGYLSSVRNLTAPAAQWEAGGVPLVSMMNVERRHGSDKPVIKKALVELDGAPFKEFAAHRPEWALSSDYRVPGGIQYFGPSELTDRPTITLMLEKGKK